MLRRFAWAPFAALAALVCVRAATAAPVTAGRVATDEERRVAYAKLADEERGMRRDAAKQFPGDPWSQDDAFHNFEWKRARAIAGESGLAVEEVLRAADDGMRERWPHDPSVWQNPSVPPCRPRPIH